MGTPAVPHEEVQRRLEVLAKYNGNTTHAAMELGISRGALQATRDKAKAEETLTVAGYDLTRPEMSPREAWDAHTETFERTVAQTLSRQWRPILRPRGPVVIFHGTDEHVDDNASALKLIEQDVTAAHRMNAVMVHTGDLLNNWPLAGKLAKQWAEQKCTMPEALLRAQHFISMFRPDVWTHGNHEEMNPYLASMLEGWLPPACLTDYWTVNFVVQTPGGRDIRVIGSHKFQKGSSYFHPHHGVLREMMEGAEADVYLEGHIHVSGILYRTMPERGMSTLAVSSAGYKVTDKYAARISRGGKIPKLKGRAHWIVCDPQADEDEFPCTAWDSARQAEMHLGALQNLRVV